mmetsp:Transcript_4036/g.10218  ORF Transcript_4036/g.10218 Transcript_4036/m.10218 type:complete len:98 (-) Transcript_4036:833-1126(-)
MKKSKQQAEKRSALLVLELITHRVDQCVYSWGVGCGSAHLYYSSMLSRTDKKEITQFGSPRSSIVIFQRDKTSKFESEPPVMKRCSENASSAPVVML